MLEHQPSSDPCLKEYCAKYVPLARKRDEQPALELMRFYTEENLAHRRDMMAHACQCA